jgi:hypothetical protein
MDTTIPTLPIPIYTLALDQTATVAKNAQFTADWLAEESFYLPETIKVYTGSVDATTGSRDLTIGFAPNGAATSLTDPHGFHVIGQPAFSGKITSVTAGAEDGSVAATVTFTGAKEWKANRWAEHAIVIVKPVAATSYIFGRCRRIVSSTTDSGTGVCTLTLAPRNTTEKGWAGWYSAAEQPVANDEFQIATFENARRIVVYSTTGRVTMEDPR